MDLFDILWNALSPYMMSIARIALAITLFSYGIKLIRSKVGHISAGGISNPYSGITSAFLGYLLCQSIPIIIGLTDSICKEIIAKMPK